MKGSLVSRRRNFEAQLRIRSKLKDFAYRPFDTRLLHYDPDKLARARFDFMRSMLEHRNLALVTIGVREMIRSLIYLSVLALQTSASFLRSIIVKYFRCM